MQMFNYIFTFIYLFTTLTFADVSGTSIKGATPNTYLLEGFNEVASSAGTTTLTKDSQTKQILTGTTTQTYVLPSATTLALSRKFLFINKSTGLMTIQTNGGGALTTVSAGSQKEVHLRAAGSAAGTWDVLNTGGVWGSISGTLGAQTDLQAALDAKPDESTLTTKGDIYAATGAGVVTRLGVSGNNGYVLTEDSSEPTGFKWAASSGGGGGVWGGITGVLSNQTDLQAALDLKAPLASPTFSGTITTPLTANRAVVTGASGVLSASATTDTQIGYLSTLSSNAQTQLNAKQARSTLTTKGDLYVATASATVARQGVGSDGQVLMSDSTQTNGVKWTTPTSENLIFDGNAESGITNFVEGSYSAATRPSGTFTPSSGSGTFAISTSSSSPLFGSNSFLLTKSSGASRQGRAIERTIAIDSGYRTKMLKTRIDYTIVSGTFVAGTNGTSPTDSSLIWYVGQFNGTTWSYTEPSTFKMFSNSTTNSDWVEGEFQVNSDTTQLKLIAYVAETANSAWVVKAEVGFKVSTYAYGTSIINAISKTYTLSNAGNATVTGTVSQIGERALFSGTITIGSSLPTSSITLNIPSGYSMAATGYLNGTVSGSIGASTYTAVGYATSSTSIVFAGPSSGTWTTAVPATWTNGNIIKFYIEVPIQGWSSSTQQSDGYDARKIGFRAEKSTAGTTTGSWQGITFTSGQVSYDDVVGWDGTGTYTIRKSDRYRITVKAIGNSTGAATNYLSVGYRVDSGTDIAVNTGVSSSGSYATGNGSDVIDLRAGQTVQMRVLTNNDTTLNGLVFSIQKDGASPTISATEKVVATYKTLSSTTITSGTALKFTTSVEDSHARYNTSTGAYLIESQGTYEFVISGINAGAATDVKMFIGATDMGVIGSLASGSGRQSIAIQHPFNAGDSITFVPQTSSSATDTVGWLMVKKIK